MQMFLAASRLSWDVWFRGLLGAFLSGGAGAIASGTAGSLLDKGHDMNVLALAGVTFLISGTFSLMKFLETTPLPPADAAKP